MNQLDREDLDVLLDVIAESLTRDPDDAKVDDFTACAFSILAGDTTETNRDRPPRPSRSARLRCHHHDQHQPRTSTRNDSHIVDEVRAHSGTRVQPPRTRHPRGEGA